MRDDDKNYLEIRNQQVEQTKNNINEIFDSMIDSATDASAKPILSAIGTGIVAGLGLIGTTLAYYSKEYITAVTIASIGCYHAVKCDNNLHTAKSYFQAKKYLGAQKAGVNQLIDEMAKRGVDVNPNNVYLDMDEENGVKLVVEELPEELLDEDGNLDMTEWDEIGKKMVDNLYDDLPSISNKDNNVPQSKDDNKKTFDDLDKLNNLIHNQMVKNRNEDEDELKNSRSENKDHDDHDPKSDDKDNSDHDHNDKSDNDMER